jgi:hypothetical protein
MFVRDSTHSPLPIPCGLDALSQHQFIFLFFFLVEISVLDSAQDLGIKKMSKSLLEAARLQKVITATYATRGGFGLLVSWIDLLWVFLQSTRASPKPRKKFEVGATEVRRSSRARNSVSYKENVSWSTSKLVLFDW